jgi:hypothetical protein
MSTEQPFGQPPVKLVTSYDIEHPHAIGRRIKAGLTLVGAAAAAVLALAGGSPAANADTVELLDFPTTTAGRSRLAPGLAALRRRQARCVRNMRFT